MFIFAPSSTAAAFVTAVSTSAAAAPLALFPFEQPQYQPPRCATAYAPVEVERQATALPSNFKRQVVNYPTNEAPGTIVIDTPNTFLYLVLGNGRALRYGIGVGREGFTWAGTKTRREEGGMAGLASAAGDDRAPALPAALHGRRPRQPARRPRHVPRPARSTASTAPTRRRPSASACPRAASA